MPPRIGLAILGFGTLLLTPQSQPQRNVILGALEYQPGIDYGKPPFRDIRVMFYKDGDEWKAFPSNWKGHQHGATRSAPNEMTWNIGFHGRILGKVTGRAVHKGSVFFAVEIGTQRITSGGPIPTVGKPSTVYNEPDTPVYRPLVANSQPYFKDREEWRPVKISPGLLALLRTSFRQKFPNVKNCKNPDENIERPWRYKDKNIELTGAYRSRTGETIAGLELGPVRCDYEDQKAYAEPWFVVRHGTGIRFIGYMLRLVDSGDYGNDGRTEVLFLNPPLECGGYTLYYDDFKKAVSFDYSPCH
jgi:hypothetical protein